MSRTTFQQFLQTGFIHGLPSTDEVVDFVLPLFEEVLSFHERGQVGSFDRPESVFLTNGRLDIDEEFTHDPENNQAALKPLLEYQQVHGYTITERVMISEDVSSGNRGISNLVVEPDINANLLYPVFLPGYKCYEFKLGHHDAQSDIFCLGLILGSVSMALNLYDLSDLEEFAVYRIQPAGKNPRIHPTVCALVAEMTELDRKARSRDLRDIIQRLIHYRDFDPSRNSDLAEEVRIAVKKPADRTEFILGKLRNRLFDTTRRNRLLYYKPNSRFVNLTVSSVPMVLHFQSIKPEHLFTWNAEISAAIIAQKDISLNKYLRFEDHPYLNAQLNGVRQLSDSDEKEYGFSQLKLVVAFLHWHNLKESVNERIQSPLLLLPVKLKRSKSLKEEKFTLEIVDNAATVNPVLSNHLKDLYGIQLPETIDFDDVSMEQFYQLVKSKIDDAKQGVKLTYIDKPRIKLVHTIAKQTINNYRKKLKHKGGASFHNIDYSYSGENYKPLGLEIFRQKIQPQTSPLEFLLTDVQPTFPSGNFADNKVKSTFELTGGENNPYSWDFDICNIVLGNFNYKKMSLVSDYNKITEHKINHEVFNELFSVEPRKEEIAAQNADPAKWYHVITADPTQARAVLKNRSGRSYIIQGPPGTGKSQTITNLIADFLAQGKTILFVCEKRAALDVVYYRLQQNRLAELCCYIHDSQGDKKSFVQNLRDVYGDFTTHRMDLQAIILNRDSELNCFKENLKILESYHKQQTSTTDNSGVPVHQLVDKLISLQRELPKPEIVNGADVPTYDKWLEFGTTLQALSNALEQTGANPELSSHPFRNLTNQLLTTDDPFRLVNNISAQAHQVLQQLNNIIQQKGIALKYAGNFQQIKDLVEDSVLLKELASSQNLKLVNTSNSEALEFDSLYQKYRQLENDYSHLLEQNKNWKNKFAATDVPIAIDIAAKNEKSFFGFINGDWRKLKKKLKESYDFAAHAVHPGYGVVLEKLKKEYESAKVASENKLALEQKYRVGNISDIQLAINLLRKKQGDAEVDYLLQHPLANETVVQLSKCNNVLQELDSQLNQYLFHYNGKTLKELQDELSTITANASVLKELLPVLRQFASLPGSLQKIIRNIPLTPAQAEAAMASKTLEIIYRQNPTYAATGQAAITHAVTLVNRSYNNLLKLNSEYIRAMKRDIFLKNYEISNTAASQLPPDKKDFKKIYTEGRKVLEHEMGKTKRYKSIRELASKESGVVLRDIKPVWLMSPLSVSDSLSLDTKFFDVVIFDEASQITLEEGIPALFRAPQTIIVGDDKQMPPSNFFNAKAEDPNDLETFEGESEDEILSTDTDSLLVQGARKLPSTMLSWHYRSKYESLISYSNHAFYNAGLLTIPDKTIHYNNKPGIEVQKPEEGANTAKYLAEGSITFHYLPNSVYEERSNLNEARYIAHMLRQLLNSEIPDTIGIVAFSQEQQSVIEEAVTELALTDKKFEEALEKSYNRTDEGQFTGLFIKNLENVQGDERDIIIMSVCYGHDANKIMRMNFGPINRRGGEKRLNVIFSRARKHMAVVSSIQHNHITNDYNEGANYLKRFLQYAEMVSTGNVTMARSILKNLITDEKKQRALQASTSVCTAQIKSALEQKGYLVDEAIGQSAFKCSLAVRKYRDSKEYNLAILVDDEAHYENDDLIEQYFQRPEILKAFGWKTINIYSKDWLEDSEKVLQSIINILENRVVMEAATPKIETKSPETLINPNIVLLRSVERRSFWEIGQAENQLTIRSGREGTRGFVEIKSYENAAEAESMKQALISEQRSKGFLGE